MHFRINYSPLLQHAILHLVLVAARLLNTIAALQLVVRVPWKEGAIVSSPQCSLLRAFRGGNSAGATIVIYHG
jgi:hypothetical protein